MYNSDYIIVDSSMRFIDLFAGLGGFHLALRDLGHECVFASEINETLREIYPINFDGLVPVGDIREVPVEKIPKHEILCAGFPCQPFSKAGSQKGLEDKERGGLFYEILKIVDYHKPQYLIFENVPNIMKHDKGNTWATLQGLLVDRNYDVKFKLLSPYDFGIPQIRQRAYIIAKAGKDSLNNFFWPTIPVKSRPTVLSVIEEQPAEAQKISPKMKECLEIWQEFLDRAPRDKKIPHPTWSMEYGATYPYEDTTPYASKFEDLLKYNGAFGKKLDGSSKCEIMSQLPTYASVGEMKFPKWKINMIKTNREFYDQNKDWLDEWKKKIYTFPASYQKLEWNCQGEDRTLCDYILQFRASGVRVKRLNTAPSLVAMTQTQVPVIGWEGRYMTVNECKKLQSMEKLIRLPNSKAKAYEALGNAINVKVARYVAESLLHEVNHGTEGIMCQEQCLIKNQ